MKVIGVAGDTIPGKSAVELIATGSVLGSSREASGPKAQAAVRPALPADESRETMSNTGIQTSLARFAKIALIDQPIVPRQPTAREKTLLARMLCGLWIKCAAGKRSARTKRRSIKISTLEETNLAAALAGAGYKERCQGKASSAFI